MSAPRPTTLTYDGKTYLTDAQLLALFRVGWDTARIASTWRVGEADVANQLAAARDAAEAERRLKIQISKSRP